MTETTALPHIAELQQAAAAFCSSMLNSSAAPLLKAQAGLLAGMEATMTDWLRRRHEAVADTQRLVTSLSASGDPADVLKAQQEWMSGALRRLTTDAAAYQSATLQWMMSRRRAQADERRVSFGHEKRLATSSVMRRRDCAAFPLHSHPQTALGFGFAVNLPRRLQPAFRTTRHPGLLRDKLRGMTSRSAGANLNRSIRGEALPFIDNKA